MDFSAIVNTPGIHQGKMFERLSKCLDKCTDSLYEKQPLHSLLQLISLIFWKHCDASEVFFKVRTLNSLQIAKW